MAEQTLTSRDGTAIAYVRRGDGPPVILVGGGLTDRSENEPLAQLLAAKFRVCNYDRRGRGASGDAATYAIERELEDLDALVRQAGGSVHVYGVSSGGALAIEAALAGVAIDALAVYEVPYAVSAESRQHFAAYRETLETALGDGRRAAALEAFMRIAGSPEGEIAAARRAPIWRELETIAHTLAYDATCLGAGVPSPERLATIAQPVLVLTGGAKVDLFEQAAHALAAGIPRARRARLEGQGHVADANAIAPRLQRFFERQRRHIRVPNARRRPSG